MGALLTLQMAPVLASHELATSALLDPAARAALSPTVLIQLQQALADALHRVFILTGIVSLAGFGCALAFPSVPHPVSTAPAPAAPPTVSGPEAVKES
jgi:hypothetical protein